MSLSKRMEGMERALQALAANAALLEAGNAQLISGHADALVAWLRDAGEELGASAPLLQVAERVAEGLRRGFDPGQGLQRLDQVLESALKLMKAPGSASAPDAGPAAAPPLDGRDGAYFLEVKPEDQEGWQDFLVEGPELLSDIEGRLVAAMRQEAIDALAVLRPLHTLKGICGMLGLMGQNRLMHACEDALQPYQRAAALPGPVLEAVLAAMDLLRRQMDGVAAGAAKGGFQVLDVRAAEQGLRAVQAAGAEAGNSGAAPDEDAPQAPEADAVARMADNVIRIPVGKMDSLLEAVSELAICQAQVTAGVLELNLHGALSAEATRLEKISRQLQQVVLGLRMVPVAPLFTRISRQAHELSRRMGKPLKVELLGGETEVDKGLVEELFEPMLHLVRNALDHGLDSPDERRAAGKPEQGLLRLTAFHQGGEFVLRMSDDGRGFDLEAIAAKARSQGLLKAGEEASDERLIDLLFHPGFSTAQTLTDLSGRGVGLDAVRRKVADLKGAVSAAHVRGQGAVFTLRLPLTMALMEAILVRTRGERYALPASNVLRFLAWDAAARHAIGHGEGWFEADGRSLPLVDLGADAQGRAVAMHVSAGGKEACLVVDEVLGKQQVVIKPLGGLLKDLPGVGGGAVLADGRVGLILDLDSLLKQHALA